MLSMNTLESPLSQGFIIWHCVRVKEFTLEKEEQEEMYIERWYVHVWKKKKSSGVVLVPNYVWRLSGFVDEGRYQTTDIASCFFYNTIE